MKRVAAPCRASRSSLAPTARSCAWPTSRSTRATISASSGRCSIFCPAGLETGLQNINTKEDKMAKYSGGCLCGQIRYETDADPIVSIQCQCRNCQKRSGGGHSSFIGFPKPAVKVTGPVKYHSVKADSGNMSSLGFCPECGSLVVSGSSGFPDMLGVMVGSLDDPGAFAPQMVVYTSRGHEWDQVDPALPKFPAMPPM